MDRYIFRKIDLPLMDQIDWFTAEPESILICKELLDNGLTGLIVNKALSLGVELEPFVYQDKTCFFVVSIAPTAPEAIELYENIVNYPMSENEDLTVTYIEKNQAFFGLDNVSRAKITKLMDFLENSNKLKSERFIPPQGGRPAKKYFVI